MEHSQSILFSSALRADEISKILNLPRELCQRRRNFLYVFLFYLLILPRELGLWYGMRWIMPKTTKLSVCFPLLSIKSYTRIRTLSFNMIWYGMRWIKQLSSRCFNGYIYSNREAFHYKWMFPNQNDFLRTESWWNSKNFLHLSPSSNF